MHDRSIWWSESSEYFPGRGFWIAMNGEETSKKTPERLYPRYMYHYLHEPLLVNNTDEEEDAARNGYDSIHQMAMANQHMSNWMWDLEDLSPKQLRVFAKEEYDVDYPEGASQVSLYKAVLTLSRWAPQNQNRITLLAQTIKMNYDETIEQIKRGIAGGTTETFTQEFFA